MNSITDYANIDPSTPNAHLHRKQMPKGLRDIEKRKWLIEKSEELKDLGKIFWKLYQKTGLQSDLSLSEACHREAEECILASKRKHIDHSPLLR